VGRWATALIALALVAVGGNVAYVSYMKATAKGYAIDGFADDLSDPRRLAGFADNVFLGEVVSDGVFARRNDGPHRTIFEVQVLESIKGALSGRILVNQVGGTDGYGNTWSLEGVPQLERDGTYLFTTRTEADAYLGETATPRVGHARARGAEQRDELLTRFERAVKDQIPYPVPNPVTHL
jgi:hypothetical protein